MVASRRCCRRGRWGFLSPSELGVGPIVGGVIVFVWVLSLSWLSSRTLFGKDLWFCGSDWIISLQINIETKEIVSRQLQRKGDRRGYFRVIADLGGVNV